jgi:predicted ATPase
LVGREDDVRLLMDSLGDCQLVTVVGAAGVGKTTLAIETGHALADRFAEGVSFVDLATSREALRVRGEQVHWLASLDYPGETAGLTREQILAYPAVELFVARASAAGGALAADLETVQVIADMCRRLDGMALPIELAAVRVATHGVHATAKLLGERFSLAWAGRRTALPRQQTLQATLDWSYSLLSNAERLTFDRLSVFLGAFSIDAALEVVVDDDLEIDVAAAALEELTAKSLISPDRWGEGGGYRILEMTRTYARGKLLSCGQDDYSATARPHATRVLNCLAANDVWRPDGGGLQGVDLSAHLGQIRAALDWSFGAGGDLDLAVPLAAASAPALLNLSLLVECRTWCARAVAQLQDVHRGGSIELELQAALGLSLMFTRGNSDSAEKALRRALEVAVELGDHFIASLAAPQRPSDNRSIGRGCPSAEGRHA